MKQKSENKKLNTEQLEAVKHGEGPLLIIAGAGTGKTTVITERIKWIISQKKATPAEILALTFTNKAAKEMEERIDVALPYGYREMWITTFHAFGDRVLRQEALQIGLDPGFRLMSQAEAIIFFRINLFKFSLSYFRPLGNPTKFIEGMLQHFSRLKDEDIEPNEYIRWASAFAKASADKQNQDEKLEREKYLELADAYKTYEELKVKEGLMDFGDLITNTLKIFRTRKNILREYHDKFKYFLVDEYQDTNIAQNELVALLVGKKPNLTVVADDDQCLPPGTQIKTSEGSKPIEQIKRGESVVSACGKGYTTLAKVIEVVRSKKDGEFFTITTVGGHEVAVTENHKMFCLTPSKVFGEKPYYYVYLMEKKGLGWRLGVTNDLAQRLRLERSADRIIGIKACMSEEEARYYETKYSLRYSIPTICFKNRDSMISRPEWLEKIYQDFNTYENVKKLAHDINIDLETHHFSLGGVYRGSKSRTKINILLCRRRNRTKWARNRYLLNPQISHTVYVETSDNKILERMKKAGFNLVKAKKGWKFSKVSINLIEIGKTAQKLQEVTEGIVEAKFDVGRSKQYAKSANVMPAKNLLPGLYIPILKGYEIQYEQIKSIRREKKKLTVFDLEIERTHNFVANNVVVHNSIYRWRGAAISNIIQFRKHFPQSRLVVLNKNYRSTQEILDKSYILIQNNNPDRLEAKEKINKKLVSVRKEKGEEIEFNYADRVENEAEGVIKKIRNSKFEIRNGKKEEIYNWKDFAILVRANNQADPFSRALQRHGIPYQFLGPGMLFRQPEVKDLIAYLKLLNNFSDSVALFRVISMSIFDISGRDVAAVTIFAKNVGISLFEAIESIVAYSEKDETHWSTKKNYQSYLPNLSDETKEKLVKFVKMVLKHLDLAKKETAGQLLYYFLEDAGFLKSLTEYKTVKEERIALNISKFFDKLKSYETNHEDASIAAVVDWIDMAMELGESPLAADLDWTENDAVNILTVHSSKGLEFPVVFLVNMVANRFPTIKRREQIPIPDALVKEILPEGDYHLEEERRLFYVGMTRARDKLFLTAANYYGEGKRERKISPFVTEALGEKNVTMRQLNNDTIKQFALHSWAKKAELPESRVKQTIEYLSYSQIETFRTCPLQYKYRYVLKIPVPPTAAGSFGTSIHITLQRFYESVMKKEKPAKADLLTFFEKAWLPIGYDTKQFEEKMIKRGIDLLNEFYDKFYNPKVIPLYLEQVFKIKLTPTLKFGGKIDRIDKIADGKLEIIDYKTGKRPTEKQIKENLQMTVYALAATDPGIYNKKSEEVILSFYFLGTQEKISSTRTDEQLEAAKKELIDKAEEIKTSNFDPKVGPWCDFCDFKLICEAWQ